MVSQGLVYNSERNDSLSFPGTFPVLGEILPIIVPIDSGVGAMIADLVKMRPNTLPRSVYILQLVG
jgi:hypothetical protein